MYAGYQLRRHYGPRRRHILTVVIIILTVVTLASIVALFLRGFKFKDLAEQINSKELQTPTMQVWLLKVQGYDSKMAAYQAGLTAADDGLGVYVMPDSGKWTWIASVYANQDAAQNELINYVNLSSDAKIFAYQINGKKFQIMPEALAACQQVLLSVQNVFKLLLDFRTAVNSGDDITCLQLDLTAEYNQIKSSADDLQTLNANWQSEVIATIIYTANQNLLGLQEIIYNDAQKAPSLAIINTALLKTIFSLDNF